MTSKWAAPVSAAQRYVVAWRGDVPYAYSYPAGLIRLAGRTENIDEYEPQRVDTQQQRV